MDRPRRGSTLIELIMVMLLLILFGVTISSLIYAGGQTQQKIISEKNSQIDARVAISYLNMRIRQSDAADRVTIQKNDETGMDSIVIKERADWGEIDTWIFWANGLLYECLVNAGEQPAVGLSERIASVERFSTGYDESGAITNVIGYSVNGAQKELRSSVRLRSGR